MTQKPNEFGQWQCSKCKKWKWDYEFYRNPYKKNGLQSWCSTCQLDYSTELREKRRAATDQIDTDQTDHEVPDIPCPPGWDRSKWHLFPYEVRIKVYEANGLQLPPGV